MWIDKHAPQSIKEVCVAPKKIEEVRQFLNSHVEYTTYQRRHTNKHQQQSMAVVDPWDIPTKPIQPQTKLQILVGSPGIGKSSLLSVLAQELNIEVLKWNDIHVDYNMNSGGGMGRDSGGGYLPYQSQLSSFEEFLNSGSVGITSLDIGGNNTSLKSSAEKKKRKGSSSSGKNSEEYVSSLILVEEIPNLYNDEAAQLFRNIMERHIQRTQTPTFFIYSDVQEGKHKPEDLERLIPPHILYSQLVQIIQIQPVTKAKMKKALQSIAKVERLGSLSTEFVEEMHLSSGGDLRHAIFALQFQSSTMMMTSRSKSSRKSSEECGSTAKKDAKLSTFHALGKLLYAKRKPATNQHHHHDFSFSDDDSMEGESAQGLPSLSQSTVWNQSKWNDGRGPLEFVPEDVLSRVDMTLSSAMSFISFHSPDFFMDVTDLSRSFDLISDSATFMDYQFSSSQNSTDGPFPMQYASCIGGRAVADGNKHPAPPQFRQFTAPKVFSVMKKNRENEYKIDKLRKRLSLGSSRSGTSQDGGGMTSIHDNIGSAQQFVTDSLPYMRSVIPQDVNYALANLHSYANDASGHANNEPQAPEEKENAVLLEDDLVDDDDENDDW